jgi:hypothetical protein
MAQFKSPPENVWHQFFNQGMPQLAGIVEGNKKAKALEKRQATQDTVSIINKMLELSGEHTKAGNDKAALNMISNVKDVVAKNDYLKELGFDMLITGAEDSSTVITNKKTYDRSVINKVLQGEISRMDARLDPTFSPDGIKTLDGMVKSGAISRYRYGDLESQLDVVNTLLNAMKKTSGDKGRLPKDLRNIMKLLGTKLGEISTTTLFREKEGLPTSLGDMELSAGFWDAPSEAKTNELVKLVDQYRAGLKIEEEEIIPDLPKTPPRTQVSGFKSAPIEGDPRNVQIEYGGKTGKISKTNWDIATGIKRAITRQGPIRAIAKALQMSPKEVERILESAQPKTEVTKPSSSPAVNKSFLKYYPPPDSLIK